MFLLFLNNLQNENMFLLCRYTTETCFPFVKFIRKNNNGNTFPLYIGSYSIETCIEKMGVKKNTMETHFHFVITNVEQKCVSIV